MAQLVEDQPVTRPRANAVARSEDNAVDCYAHAEFVWPSPVPHPYEPKPLVPRDERRRLRKKARGYPHFVNIDPTHADEAGIPEEACGQTLTVKARVKEAHYRDRVSVLYLKAEFGEGNSKRNDPPLKLEGTTLNTTGVSIIQPADVQTIGDARVAQFKLDLGAAGGDIVHLSVGCTEFSWDDHCDVVTWRRLRICPVLPSDEEDAPGQIATVWKRELLEAALEHMEGALKSAFIDSRVAEERYEPVKYTIMKAETCRELGMIEEDRLVLSLSDAGSAPDKMLCNEWSKGGRPQKPDLYCALGHILAGERKEQVLFIQMAKPTSPWKQAKWGEFYSHRISGEPSFSSAEGDHRKWQVGLLEGLVTPDFLEFDKKRGVRVLLPKDQSRAPGQLVSAEEQASVRVHLWATLTQGGSSTSPWVTAVGRDAKRLAFTILHELGHALGLTRSKLPPGMDEPHTYTYQYHEHQGDHCSFGLSKKDRDRDDYMKLVEKGTHGKCIMWGALGKKPDLAKMMVFCEHCRPYARAAKVVFPQ